MALQENCTGKADSIDGRREEHDLAYVWLGRMIGRTERLGTVVRVRKTRKTKTKRNMDIGRDRDRTGLGLIS